MISAIEHPAVRNTCGWLREHLGVELITVPVSSAGRVDPQRVADAIDERTAMVSIMLANNDIGTLQPIAEIAELARAHGVLMHTDAVQAAGKIAIDVDVLGVDLLSLSAHKLRGPKGVGALYVRQGTKLSAQLCGGGQELDRRSGTENVAGAVGFGRACAQADQSRMAFETTIVGRRDRLQRQLLEFFPEARVNGDSEYRLPNTLSISFARVDGNALVMNLDLLGIAASAGAACATGAVAPSVTLSALGLSASEALGHLKIVAGA